MIHTLGQGRVDLAVLDREPGLALVSEGKAREVGKSAYVQDYAIAVRNGSMLKARFNRELAALMADGTVRRLAAQYLNLPEPNFTPVPPATEEPPATPAPAVTPAPIDDLTAGQDVDLTVPDNTAMKPGQAFRKGWRLTNSGTSTWSPEYRVVYADGIPDSPATQMGGLPTQIGATVQPGARVDVYVDLVAPQEPGTYKAFWQMEDAAGRPFGDQFWVQIVVPSPATPTPRPAPTAQPGISYKVEPPSVQLGGSTRISWSVSGTVKSVYFCAQPSVACEGVGQNDSRQRTPGSVPVTYYELQVEQTNGQWMVQPVPVNVTQPPAGPVIQGFSVIGRRAVRGPVVAGVGQPAPGRDRSGRPRGTGRGRRQRLGQ